MVLFRMKVHAPCTDHARGYVQEFILIHMLKVSFNSVEKSLYL